MPEARSNADSADCLVFRAISAERAPSRADRQEVPSLDLVGAAIARAARLAAAEDRARRACALVERSQAAELLRAARDAAHAARTLSPRAPAPSFADLAAGAHPSEGRVIPETARATGFVWRFHAAPGDAGLPIALGEGGALA